MTGSHGGAFLPWAFSCPQTHENPARLLRRFARRPGGCRFLHHCLPSQPSGLFVSDLEINSDVIHVFPLQHSFELSIDYSADVPVAFHLAVQHETLPALQHPRQVARAEPRGRDVSARVAKQRGERRSGSPRRRRAQPHHHARAGLAFSRHEGVERSELRAVLVTGRDVEERVLDGLEAQARELSRSRGADALQILKRRVERGTGTGVQGGRHSDRHGESSHACGIAQIASFRAPCYKRWSFRASREELHGPAL